MERRPDLRLMDLRGAVCVKLQYAGPHEEISFYRMVHVSRGVSYVISHEIARFLNIHIGAGLKISQKSPDTPGYDYRDKSLTDMQREVASTFKVQFPTIDSLIAEAEKPKLPI